MKRFCFLIFALIVNVLTNDIMEYKWEMVMTNALIEYVYDMNDCKVNGNIIANGLEHVIETIVLKENYDLDALNRMLIIPEFPYFKSLEDRILFDCPKSKNLQCAIQNEIKTQFETSTFGLPDKDLTKLPFKDLGDKRRRLTGIALRNIIRQAIGYERKVSSVEEPGVSELLKKRKALVTPRFNDKFNTLSIHDTTGHNSLKLSAASGKDKSEINDDNDDDFCMIDSYEGQNDKTTVRPSSANELTKKRKVLVTPSFNDKFSTLNLYDPTEHNSVDLNNAHAKEKSKVNDDGNYDFCDGSKVPSVDMCGISKSIKKRKDLGTSSVYDDFGALSIHDTTGHNSSKLDEFSFIEHDECQDDEIAVQSFIERPEIIVNYFGKDGGQPSNGNPHVTLKQICQFTALFLSTKWRDPDLEALIDDDEKTCTIKIKTTVARTKPQTFVYRQINGIWCQGLKNLIV